MKRLLPTSMAGWLILVIVVGLVLTQAVTIAIHYNSRRDAQLLLENVRIVERVVALTRSYFLINPAATGARSKPNFPERTLI